MIETLVTLAVSVVIGFCWWKLNSNYYKAIPLFIWSWMGPDIPKLFLNGSESLVNPNAWYLAIATGILWLVSKSVLKQAKHLNYILFLEIGLVSHLTIDYLFNFI